MINEIDLKVSTENSPRTVKVRATPMVVVIGPNNAGKSLLIREVRSLLENSGNAANLLVARVGLHPLEEAKAQAIFDGANGKRVPVRSRAGIPPGSATQIFIAPDLEHHRDMQANLTLDDFIGDVSSNRKLWDVARVFSLHIPGVNRQVILNEDGGDKAPLPSLLFDRRSRNRLSEIVHDAIDFHLCVDAAPLKSCRAKLSRTPLPDNLEETWRPEARAFLEAQPDLESFSDGIRCFVGILSSFMFGNFLVYTVDEPEAFLHPPLERRLGKAISELSADADAVTIASTHSPDFLMGCVQSGKPVTVIRLTYENGTSSARSLEAASLQTMMREPLLRSSGVLGALFYRGAVVTEADADRAFYEEVNLRLLNVGRGSRDVSFMNANGCHTIKRIIEPLRRMGLPAAAIVDLDVVKDKGGLCDLLKAAYVPGPVVESLAILRARVESAFGNDDPKKVGVKGLADPQPAIDLLDQAARYGVFIVPTGELETWLSDLGISSRKPRWLVDMFDRMGADAGSPSYVRPGEDDVWAFVDRVAAWINDPKRVGIPG